MADRAQVEKAITLRGLHEGPRLLVLPNVWDPLGARLLAELGYPAVATASAAVAFSLGHDDGERIPLSAMLDAIARIAASVDLPVTADFERGYAAEPEAVAENVRLVIRAGAVGVNLEDSTVEGGPLRPIARQQETLRAVRSMAEGEGIPLVINARTDVFLGSDSASPEKKLSEAIRRAHAYLEAGADCIYPIGAADAPTLRTLRREIRAPLNVYATRGTPPMRELEEMGIRRLSLGPGLIKASLTTMKRVAEELLRYGSYDAFTEGVLSSEEVRAYVSKEPRSS